MFSTLIAKTKWKQLVARRQNQVHFRSLYIFNTENRFRKLVYSISSSPIFEYFILLSIIISVILLVQQGADRSDLSSPYFILDLLFNIIFALEAVLKIISYGFVLHEGAYLRDQWNVFDFIVVVVGIISDALVLSKSVNQSMSFKFLRLFRVLRPLRLIAKSENLRVVLDTLIKSFGALLHVLMFIFLIIVLYAISGLELFGGLLHTACVNDTSKRIIKPVTLCSTSNKNSCSKLANSSCQTWTGDEGDLMSYDNMGYAMMTVVQVITMEDWIFIVYKFNIVTSPIVTWIYFVSLILFGGYFAIDLLMGVLGNQFLRAKQLMKKMKKIKEIQDKKETEKKKALKNYTSWLQVNNDMEEPSSHPKREKYNDNCKMQELCLSIIKTSTFFWTILFIIVIDATVSCVYAHLSNGENVSTTYISIKAALMFLYFLEMLLTIVAKGFRKVLTESFFLFNTVILVAAFVELISFCITNEVFIGLTIIRTVSLIQVFKQTRIWSHLASIINSFVESIKGVAGVMALLLIVLTNYALIGNQLFADPDVNRKSIGTFDTFGSSLFLSFVLLTGDNWKALMVEYLNASGSTFNNFLTITYFISFLTVGNFILMNVFLGIIVDNLTSDFEENTENEGDAKQKNSSLKGIEFIDVTAKSMSTPLSRSYKSQNEALSYPKTEATAQMVENDYSSTSFCDHLAAPAYAGDHKTKDVRFAISHKSIMEDDSSMVIATQPKRNRIPHEVSHAYRERARTLSFLVDPDILHPIPNHKSLFLFDHGSQFRQNIFWLVTSSQFTIVVGVAIVLSSLSMAFDDPLNADITRVKVMQIIDYVFTGFFVLEIVLKSIAYGLFFGHKNCYLRNPMNIVDTLIVCISVINICMQLLGYDGQYHVRVLRAIRVLRMLKISSELKSVINCLISSIQKIIYFLVLYFMILFVYSIIGVHLYRGSIGHCSDPQISIKLSCFNNNQTWSTDQLAFDNIAMGLATLFVLSTTDDWFNFTLKLVKIENSNEIVAVIYIVSFIMIMTFVMVNVFIGFVIVVFHKEKEKEEKVQVLDKSAQECIMAALSNDQSVFTQHYKLMERLADVVSSTWFQAISFVLIILNTIFLMSQHYQQSATMDMVQKYSNITFTACFTVEIILKLMATPIKHFIRDPWSVFDTIAVLGSWVDIVLDELNVPFLNLSLFRLFRVARLAKVVGKGGNLRQLVATFMKSMKSVPAIAFLMAIILYLYAIIGMELFGKIRLDENTVINNDANFQSFAPAIMVLIRVATLDAWNEIMLACADVSASNCQNSGGNCGTYIAYFYFASFVFICSYIMTNLFLAVIMENFVYLTRDMATLDFRHILRFKEAWGKFDKDGSGYISLERLIGLLRALDPPLGVGLFCPARSVCSKIIRLKVPIEESNYVKYNELLLTLIIDALQLRVSNDVIRDDVERLTPNIDDDLLDRVLPLSMSPRKFNNAEISFYEQCAAFVISGNYKIYKSTMKKFLTQEETKNNNALERIFKCSSSFILQNHQTRSDELIREKYSILFGSSTM